MARQNFNVPGGITVDQSTLYVDDPNNRVGIANTNPQQALDVVGNATVSGWVKGTEGVIAPTSSGVPNTTIADGALAVDTTGHTLYVRSGGTWRTSVATGPTGPTGPTGATGANGIEISATPPTNTDILWADTTHPFSGGMNLIDSQTFTSSTTYNIPVNAKTVVVESLSAGGGGGGGRRSSGTDNASGGGGGAGGVRVTKTYHVSELPSSVTVTIGAGGAGGAGGTADGVDGIAGGHGGRNRFGYYYFHQSLAGHGGNEFGAAGGSGHLYDKYTNALLSLVPGQVSPYTHSGYTAPYDGNSNGTPSGGGSGYTNQNGSPGRQGFRSGGGGAGGGGMFSSTASNGAAGGSSSTDLASIFPPSVATDVNSAQLHGSVAAGGGGSAGTSGGSGGNGTDNAGGGSGAGTRTNATAGAGGNGAIPGGGGGGGGGANDSKNGGAGGSGGRGEIRMWVYG